MSMHVHPTYLLELKLHTLERAKAAVNSGVSTKFVLTALKNDLRAIEALR